VDAVPALHRGQRIGVARVRGVQLADRRLAPAGVGLVPAVDVAVDEGFEAAHGVTPVWFGGRDRSPVGRIFPAARSAGDYVAGKRLQAVECSQPLPPCAPCPSSTSLTPAPTFPPSPRPRCKARPSSRTPAAPTPAPR